MFEFRFQEAPIVVLMACPVCTRQRVEHTGVSIRYQQSVLCAPHRAHLEKLLRDPQTPRLAITCYLNLIRKRGNNGAD